MAWHLSEEYGALYVLDVDSGGTVPVGIGVTFVRLTPDEALAFAIEVIVQATMAKRRQRTAEPMISTETDGPADLSEALQQRIQRSEFRTTRG